MLISIQEISKTTTIPETTIRRYIQVFDDVFPQGTKLGRTTKYQPNTVDIIQTIHTLYKEGLSTIEIRGELSNSDVNEFATTTLPPQKTESLQADIRALTDAIQEMTQTLKFFHPPHNHDLTTTQLHHNHNTTATETDTQKEKLSPIITTQPPIIHNDSTTKPAHIVLKQEPQVDENVKPVVESTEPPHDPEPDKNPEESPIASIDQDLPDYHGKKLTTAERRSIILKVASMITGPKCAQKRAEALNKAGVKTGLGASWTAKKISDAITKAKKHQGK